MRGGGEAFELFARLVVHFEEFNAAFTGGAVAAGDACLVIHPHHFAFYANVLPAAGKLDIELEEIAGMDARMDALGEKRQDGQALEEEDKAFLRFVGLYWIVVILLVGVVCGVAVLDFWATRVYWMARYREIKTDHDTKLQRDLAVYRQQKLNDRVKGLKQPDDDTTPEGDPPVK